MPHSTPPVRTEGTGLPVVRGQRLYLRELTIGDVADRYCGWMNDPEVTRFLESRFVPHTVDTLRAYVADVTSRPDVMPFAIVLNGDRHIGNIKLGPIDPHHRCGDIGILIGERDAWGAGYASEAICLLVDYAFGSLGLHKVTAGCYENNGGAIRAFLRAGFVQEGLRHRQYFCEGRYVDAILLGKVNPGSPSSASPND